MFLSFVYLFTTNKVSELIRNFDYFVGFGILIFSVFNFSYIPYSLGIDTGNVKIIGVFFFLLLIFHVYTEPKQFKVKYNRFEKLFFFFLILFFTISLIVNFKDFLNADGLFKIITIIGAAYFWIFFFSKRMLSSPRLMNFVINFIFWVGLLSGLYGFFTILYPQVNSLNPIPGTAVSFYQHPNAAAFIYNFSVPCAIYRLIKNKGKVFSSFLIILSLFFMLVNLLFTYSRSGIVVVFLGILMFLYFNYKKTFVFILLILPIIYATLISGFTSSKGLLTLLGRYELLYTSLEIFKSSKLGLYFGFGTYSITDIFDSFRQSLGIRDSHNYPHNFLIYFTLQFGLFTAITFFILLFYIISRGVKSFFLKKNSLEFALAVCIVVPTTLQALMEDFVLFPEFYLFHFYLIFIGVIFHYIKVYKLNAVSN